MHFYVVISNCGLSDSSRCATILTQPVVVLTGIESTIILQRKCRRVRDSNPQPPVQDTVQLVTQLCRASLVPVHNGTSE